MKKLVVMLVVVAFLATAGSAAADSPYRRVIIPKTGLSVAIQPLKLGEESNGVTAFVQESWSQAIYLPWAGLASPGGGLGSLKSGDAVLLHRDWGGKDGPLRLRVLWTQIIAAEDEESVVLARVSARFFALITYPPCGNVDQRLVVWLARR